MKHNKSLVGDGGVGVGALGRYHVTSLILMIFFLNNYLLIVILIFKMSLHQMICCYDLHFWATVELSIFRNLYQSAYESQ